MKRNHEQRENAEHQRHHAPSREGRVPATEPGGTAHRERAHAAESRNDAAHRGAHDKHAGHSVEMFRIKFWNSLALTIPTVLWGHMLMRLTGYQAPAFLGSQWIAPVFGTAVFLYGGQVFLQGAWRELKDRLPGMMTLISLAIIVAFGFSAAVTLGFPGMPLWEELATLVTVMLLGHWIEMKSISQAQGALKELAKLLPGAAERLVGDRVETVPLDALRDGDLLLIRPGASIPADGVVHEGRSSVNESIDAAGPHPSPVPTRSATASARTICSCKVAQAAPEPLLCIRHYGL